MPLLSILDPVTLDTVTLGRIVLDPTSVHSITPPFDPVSLNITSLDIASLETSRPIPPRLVPPCPPRPHIPSHNPRYILNCHELYETPQCVWVVMEIIRGGELLDLLIEGGVYTEKDASRCMKQVFLAIRFTPSPRRRFCLRLCSACLSALLLSLLCLCLCSACVSALSFERWLSL